MRWLPLVVLVAACGDNFSPPRDCVDGWQQWGGGATHNGMSCATGQALDRALADIVYDPFIAEEEADADGELIIHYQAPLIDGDDVYMMAKLGTYNSGTALDPYGKNSQVWSEQAFHWAGDQLVADWTYQSDWKPPPWIGFEPMFQPALDGDLIAIPGAGGTVHEVDRASGALVRDVNPFATIDPDTYVAGGIAVAPDGTLYYTTLSLAHDASFDTDARGSALVAVAPDGSARTVDLTTLIPGAPAATDMCETYFDVSMTPLPWPPSPDTPPREVPCGTQRAGINATPAIGPDGRVFVVTKAHFADRYSYVVAIMPDLHLLWARSLRGLLHDGCGVLTRIDGTDTENVYDCKVGAKQGVDLATNRPPAAQVSDQSSSAPVALADGGVIYGAYTGYNGSRGHLFRFDDHGAPTASYDFGWDTTPAVIDDDRGFHVILKDNHYGTDENGVDLGPYTIDSLDPDLHPSWQFLNSETQSCFHEADGTLVCTADHPNGFEWCINAPAVDAAGTFFGNAEDGWLYAVDKHGALVGRFFLDQAEGAAYTPIALDHTGRIYAMNNGHLVVVGAQ